MTDVKDFSDLQRVNFASKFGNFFINISVFLKTSWGHNFKGKIIF